MTKKFTEEQYQEIINFEDFEVVYRLGLFDSFVGEIIPFIDKNKLQQEAIALANPLTREWAHDKFVEKEPEFHFILKNTHDSECWRYHLVRNGRGAIITFPWSEENDDKPVFKESEIIKWGYNPEMFDREEV